MLGVDADLNELDAAIWEGSIDAERFEQEIGEMLLEDGILDDRALHPVDPDLAANDDLPRVEHPNIVGSDMKPSLPVSVLMEMARARLKPQLDALDAAGQDQRAA
ncbi:MAG: hypothetical protein R3D29_15605 [Nitratireductor sp.]